MAVERGPALCQEYLEYREIDYGFVVCHSELPADGTCTKKHASTRDVAERFHDWGYKQGLSEIYYFLESGMPAYGVKEFIKEYFEEEVK